MGKAQLHAFSAANADDANYSVAVRPHTRLSRLIVGFESVLASSVQRYRQKICRGSHGSLMALSAGYWPVSGGFKGSRHVFSLTSDVGWKFPSFLPL